MADALKKYNQRATQDSKVQFNKIVNVLKDKTVLSIMEKKILANAYTHLSDVLWKEENKLSSQYIEIALKFDPFKMGKRIKTCL